MSVRSTPPLDGPFCSQEAGPSAYSSACVEVKSMVGGKVVGGTRSLAVGRPFLAVLHVQRERRRKWAQWPGHSTGSKP